MSPAVPRRIVRWVHVVGIVPILGLVYGPDSTPIDYIWMFRWIIVPVMALTGLWMWKGHLLSRSRRP